MSKVKTKKQSKVKELVVDSNFKFIISASVWKYIIKQLDLLDEANFIASEKGIELRAMDPSRVAMVDLAIPAAFFDEYHLKENTRLGINLEEMRSIMNRSSSSEILELELVDPSKIRLSFIDDSTRHFTLELSDLGESEYPAPTIDSSAKIKLVASVMQKAIKDARIIGDHLNLYAAKNKLVLSSVSETKSMKTVLDEDCNSIAEFSFKSDAKATYSLSYLEAMINKLKSAELIAINFSSSMPITVEIPLARGARLRFFLSPRIEA